MSVSQQLAPTKEPQENYTPEKGRFIAEAFAAGVPVATSCKDFPEWLPAPMYVRRWRGQWPAFDMLMNEAGEVRAEELIEGTITTAKDDKYTAGQARNIINASEKLAGYLDRHRYAQGAAAKSPADAIQAPVFLMTDEQLLIIAGGGVAAPIDGECERLAPEGVPPPDAERGRTRYEVPDTQQPENTSGGSFVTTKISENDSVTTTEDMPEKSLEPGEVDGEVVVIERDFEGNEYCGDVMDERDSGRRSFL